MSNADFQSELNWWDNELSGHGEMPLLVKNRTEPEKFFIEFPDILFKYFYYLKQVGVDKPKILDVGSGPLPLLNYAAYNNFAEITCADPLADEYAKLLEKHGFENKYCTIVKCAGEELSSVFEKESFDIVWMQNALDHSQSPKKTMQEMAFVLKPGGYLFITGHVREGSHANWTGLHQNDIFISPMGKLMRETPTFIECLDQELPLTRIDMTAPSYHIREWMRIIYRKDYNSPTYNGNTMTLETFVNNLPIIKKYPQRSYVGFPSKSYIIAASGRDGGTLLCDLLTRTGVAGRPFEYFNFGEDGYLKKAKECTDFSFEKYLELITTLTSTSNGVFADKDIYHSHSSLKFPLDKYNPKYIHLSRRNKIRQGISLYKATKTKAWGYFVKAENEVSEDDYSYDEIEKMILWVTQQDEAWRRFFEQHNITPVHVIYEDFVEDMAGTISRVLKEALDIDFPADKVPKPTLKKQADELSEYFYERYIEESKRSKQN